MLSHTSLCDFFHKHTLKLIRSPMFRLTFGKVMVVSEKLNVTSISKLNSEIQIVFWLTNKGPLEKKYFFLIGWSSNFCSVFSFCFCTPKRSSTTLLAASWENEPFFSVSLIILFYWKGNHQTMDIHYGHAVLGGRERANKSLAFSLFNYSRKAQKTPSWFR